MEVRYREVFLRDLKKLKNHLVYDQVFELAFTKLPAIHTLRDVPGVRAMKGHPNRYRIRIGNYRVGIEMHSDIVEVLRVLHRREFYVISLKLVRLTSHAADAAKSHAADAWALA